MVEIMSQFDLPDTYIQNQQDILSSLTLEEARSIAKSRFNVNKMYLAYKL